MKKMMLFIALAISSIALNAQTTKFDVEKHHKEQAAFYQRELDLTDAELDVFKPMLEDYMHKKFALNKEVRNASRELKARTTRTDEEYQKVIEQALDAKVKEAELQRDFYRKLSKVLSGEKKFRYYRAEKKFMRCAVDNYHGRWSDSDSNDRGRGRGHKGGYGCDVKRTECPLAQ